MTDQELLDEAGRAGRRTREAMLRYGYGVWVLILNFAVLAAGFGVLGLHWAVFWGAVSGGVLGSIAVLLWKTVRA